jgi:hypothetical protein
MSTDRDTQNSIDIAEISATLASVSEAVADLKVESNNRIRKASEDHRTVMEKLDQINQTLSHQQGFVNAIKYVAAPIAVVAMGALAVLWKILTGGAAPPMK